MKKLFLVILLFFLALMLFASADIGLSFDVASIQDFAIKNGSYNFNGDARLRINDSFELRVPVGLVMKERSRMFECGLFAVYYPFNKLGFFMSMSLLQFGFVKPENLISKSIVSLNEVIIGYKWQTKKKFFLEGAVSVRDPSGTFSDEYSALKAAFPCYKSFRFHLNSGFGFSINRSIKK